MRPTTQPQSAIRTPLNRIFGTEANVRVLRVLSQGSTPLSSSELARRAQLQRSSVHRTLKMLEDAGIVLFVGTGVQRNVALRDDNPLAPGIRQLYSLEGKRFERLIAGVGKAAASLQPPPIAVWIEGRVAQGVDRPNDPVTVGVVDGPRSLPDVVESLRRRLADLERKLDLTIEVRGRTLADIDTMPPREAAAIEDSIPIVGVPAAGLLMRHQALVPKVRNLRVHADHDRGARQLGAEVAEALTRDPSLIERARSYTEKRWREASPQERKELDEWRRILRTASPARLRRILTDPGERSKRLRQTLPFLGVLGPKGDSE